MADLPNAKSPNSAASAKMPGEVVRGLVSLFIIIHLLGIGLGIATNSGWPTSVLLVRLKRVPILNQYIYALWLDVGYSYPLYRDISDTDHITTVTAVYPDGRRETILEFPAENDKGLAAERYLALGNRLAMPAYVEGANNSEMVAGIGKAILSRKDLKEAGVKEVVFETSRRMPLTMDDITASDAKQREPRHPRTLNRVRTAIVTLSRSGTAQVSTPAAEARDVAPVTPGAGAASGAESTQPRLRSRSPLTVPRQPANNEPAEEPKFSLPRAVQDLNPPPEQPKK